MLIKRLGNTGDTIVEVMIVLTVLGLALSISYATANRSLLNARQAEENAQATRYVQSQVESLFTLAAGGFQVKSTDPRNSPTNIFSWDVGFCMPTSTGVPKPVADNTPPTCANFGPATSQQYKLTVYYCYLINPVINPTNPPNLCPSPSHPGTFVVYASWPDVAGDGTDTITQVYRIYPGE